MLNGCASTVISVDDFITLPWPEWLAARDKDNQQRPTPTVETPDAQARVISLRENLSTVRVSLFERVLGRSSTML